MKMSDSNKDGQSCIRAILQQVLSARLQVRPPSDDMNAEYVEIQRGLVIYICFLKGAEPEMINKTVKDLLSVKLSYCNTLKKNVSILDLPGDVLVVPQATLGGKMKGKAMQYHANINKDIGKNLYEMFVAECQKLVDEKSTACNSSVKPSVKFGTYGNRQVLSMDTNGPYTHAFEFT